MVAVNEAGCTVEHTESQHLGGWGRMNTHEDPDQSGLHIASKQKWRSVLLLTNPQDFPCQRQAGTLAANRKLVPQKRNVILLLM